MEYHNFLNYSSKKSLDTFLSNQKYYHKINIEEE